jgi:hypothetical protein
MDEAGIGVPQHLVGLHADRRRDRVAHVAAAVRTEHEHEVGRCRDDAPEVGGAAARGGDEGERQEQRDGEANDAEGDLDDDQLAEAVVGIGSDRASGIERHVRGQVGEDPQPLDRVGRLDVLVRRLPHGHRPPREKRAPGRRQVADEPPLLLELPPHHRVRRPGDRGLVVVTAHGRRDPAVEERVRALVQDGGRRLRVGGGAGADEQHLLHVALRERPLAGGDLEHRRAVLRTRGRPDGEADRDRRRERKRGQDRRDRSTAGACKR